jgi:rhodanese-related sulfurtransferase
MSDLLPEEVDVESAARLLPPGSTRWIDCREIDEWHICHIAGAELLPLSNFVEEAKRKLADLSQPLIVYCHHGVRSLNATRWLRAQGYSHAQSLRGGIDHWSDVIDPEMPRY